MSRKECPNEYKIITINVPMPLIRHMDQQIINGLFKSRTEIVRMALYAFFDPFLQNLVKLPGGCATLLANDTTYDRQIHYAAKPKLYEPKPKLYEPIMVDGKPLFTRPTLKETPP